MDTTWTEKDLNQIGFATELQVASRRKDGSLRPHVTIRAGGIERDVTFITPAPSAHAAIDAAYHAKYDRHGPQIVGTVVGPCAAAATVHLVPATA